MSLHDVGSTISRCFIRMEEESLKPSDAKILVSARHPRHPFRQRRVCVVVTRLPTDRVYASQRCGVIFRSYIS